jgi:hypothetical protein
MTNKQYVEDFTKQCIDAYINQYVDPYGHKIAGMPFVFLNTKTKKFSWQSDLAPETKNEYPVLKISRELYEEVIGKDPEEAREFIKGQIDEDLVIDWLTNAAESKMEKMPFSKKDKDFIWADWSNSIQHLMWLVGASESDFASWIEAGS